MNEQSNRIIFGAMRRDTDYDLLYFFNTAKSAYPEHGWIMSGLKIKVNTENRRPIRAVEKTLMAHAIT